MLDTTLSEVPVGSIQVIPGFNPRRFFDPQALESLAESIRKEGVIQPITLRPHPSEEGYAVVAGERRLRAARMAGLNLIPAVIRNYTDEQALAAATIENQERENISVAEEAQIARRALDLAEGDRAEAGRILGWTTSKIEARLLLLNAQPFVLDAIASKTIRIGHGELLSTLTPELQKSVFDKIITHNVTVEMLRDQLAAFTQDLRKAPFSVEGCKGCPHNSATQATLFEFHIGDGRCSNRPCWERKVEEYLDLRKKDLATEFNVVWFDREKDPATYVALAETGKDGVGEGQFQTGCKACSMFGAVIGTAPGRQGAVTSPVCFNRVCNTEKRAEYQDSLPPAADTPASSQKASTAKKQAAKKGAGKKVAATATVGSPKKVVEHVHSEIRRLAGEAASSDDHVQRVLVVYALRTLLSENGPNSPSSAVRPLFAMNNGELASEQTRLITKLLASHEGRYGDMLSTTGFVAVAAQALKDVRFSFAGAVPLSREFLESHTKSGLEALLASAEIYRSLEGQDDDAKQKAFKKLMTGKNPEIVNAVLALNHDTAQFIPAAVDEAFTKLTENK